MNKVFQLRNMLSLVVGFNIFVACVGKNAEEENRSLDSTEVLTAVPDEKALLWHYDAEADTMLRDSVPAAITVEQVIEELNTRYGNSKLELVRQANDTIFIKIDDISYLSQLGSSGNYGFLAEIVYSLTELPSVKLVDLFFQETDHASPGLYSREDFNNKIH